jgi:hypothetical protein
VAPQAIATNAAKPEDREKQAGTPEAPNPEAQGNRTEKAGSDIQPAPNSAAVIGKAQPAPPACGKSAEADTTPVALKSTTEASRIEAIRIAADSRGTTTSAAVVPDKPAPAPRPAPRWRVLLADDFHINPRNFASLHAALGSGEFGVTIGITDPVAREMMKANGAYAGTKHSLLAAHRLFVGVQSFESLLSCRYHNVDIIGCAMDEALSACLATETWQREAITKDRHDLARRLWRTERCLLLDCCAAAMYWTDHWRTLPELHQFHAAVVFSGSDIYGRVLLELLTYTKARTFVCESFMTGFDYYFEERHRPIANAPLISYPNVYRSLAANIESDRDRWYRDKIRAFNKLSTMKNKNVQQPDPTPLPAALRGRRVALVLGQVVNDYSVISGDGSVLATLPAYRDMVSSLLRDPDIFVVFKAHPWERKKSNVMRPFTADAMQAWVDNDLPLHRDRVLITEDTNLRQLLGVADSVFTLCSQAGLEAAAEGFKVFTIGGAFYDVCGTGGFTNAFDHPVEAVEAYLSGIARPVLDLTEFSAFETFHAVMLQRYLINTDDSGRQKIQRTLQMYAPQSHASGPHSELAVLPTWAEDEIRAAPNCLEMTRQIYSHVLCDGTRAA